MSWEYKGGSGRWQEYVNTETGESSIKEHHLKLVGTWCAEQDHQYVLKNPRSREIECEICGAFKTFIPGIHRLVNGKVSQMNPDADSKK